MNEKLERDQGHTIFFLEGGGLLKQGLCKYLQNEFKDRVMLNLGII
jgi:hypothetical protein